MSGIVYEDEFLTEWDDGREEVRFSDGEWEIMLADPAFGYICRGGHRLSEAEAMHGHCNACGAMDDGEDASDACADDHGDATPIPASPACDPDDEDDLPF